MQVILLERIPKLGQMGDTVRVRDGYARNWLLPQGKALRATDANRKRFEEQRTQLEARNLEARNEAAAVAERLNGQMVTVIRQAGERGQLYGSVTTRDIADLLGTSGFTVARGQVVLNSPIKMIGLAEVPVRLHPEVEAFVRVNIARSEDEAERQARGEDMTRLRDQDEEEDLDLAEDAERFFEEGAEPEDAGDAGESEEASGRDA